ncbi:RNA polymerase sigma factor [Pedobacter alpinus]|uniref:RNA polymerase sigma factor n=1 Tax=Pedobacter alpinus TaxID=1590643 RepID=A0ABW5TTA5_9SPHI
MIKEIQVLDDLLLLKRVSLKDQLAFAELYNRYRKKVYTYSLKILKYPDRAEDIVHEIFLTIWQHDNLESILNLDAYLRVVTRNHTLKLLRRQQLELKSNKCMFVGWQEVHNETEQEILLKDTNAQLVQGIDKLPPQQKKVYQLCREQGLKYEEAAEQLSISRLTVKTHMQHALRFLRTYLTQHTDVIGLLLFLKFFF